MEIEPTRRGRIEYLEQGFILHWDQSGLRIQVTDYHASPLSLSWKDILAIATVARAPGRSLDRDQ